MWRARYRRTRGKKIIQVPDRSMNSSRRIYRAGGNVGDDSRGFEIKRENIPMRASTHARTAAEINSARAIYAQNSRKFNGGLGKTTLGILPLPDFNDPPPPPPPEKFNYHLRFQLKRATMGATLIKVDIKSGSLATHRRRFTRAI